jgi:hypothetical protein
MTEFKKLTSAIDADLTNLYNEIKLLKEEIKNLKDNQKKLQNETNIKILSIQRTQQINAKKASRRQQSS